jgi:hypothetical protein
MAPRKFGLTRSALSGRTLQKIDPDDTTANKCADQAKGS